jgi:hypothetical protein
VRLRAASGRRRPRRTDAAPGSGSGTGGGTCASPGSRPNAQKRGADEIGWPAHRGWQVPKHFLLEPRDGRQAGRRLGPRDRGEFGKVQTRRPCLGQGYRRGARKPGKFFDAIEVAEVGGERLCDSCFESVGIDRLKEAAGQASSEPLDRQGLQPMTARYGRLRSGDCCVGAGRLDPPHVTPEFRNYVAGAPNLFFRFVA